MLKILKFQYRFKIHNAQLNRRQFTRDYYGLKKQILVSKSAEMCG